MAAETIVSTVLQQLTSIIGKEVEQEVRLVVGVRKEIKKLTNNFQAIQAVLVDAEQRHVKESAVRVWLDKLKDSAYDMDDVLDEWSTAILKQQVEGAENAPIPKKKVPFMFTSPCFCFRQVALRHDIGVKIKEINENIDSIAIEKDRYNLNTIRIVEKPQRLKTTSFIEVSEVYGRDKSKNNLVSKLLNESKERTSLPVISIVGVGGIGKTTLAQLAYNDIEIRSKFDKRIWVCVSDPFEEVRIARAIIEGLEGQATTLVEFQSLLECIGETIVNKKFLLILDDVWNEDYDKWGPLYNCLQSGLHNGSKIVVTTRKEKVARMMKSIDVINIGVLPVNESWLLFKQLAFCDRSQEECERLENIGREILGKCKGLPLAIKSVGSLLRFKKTRDQWQRILDSELWKLEELEEGLFPPLLLSYNDLSFRVKQCFSYCAIYPKDYVMKKDELIKLWMAQGYLGLEQNEEMEIIGEECFDTLAMHSFFQEFRKVKYDNIVACKMHDIVHDFAQFLVKNECFTMEIENSEELSSTISFEKFRHLTLIPRGLNGINICSAPKLRSLFIMGYHHRARCSFPSNTFDKLTCLRALTLCLSGVNIIPSEIGKLLHLRYVDLSRLEIKELPETLCCLYNMQTLNLRECAFLVKLPQGMGKLINLRHLLTAGTKALSYMPKGIERLTCLQTLDTFVVGSDAHGMGVGSLECLKNLNKLRGNLKLYWLKNVVDEAKAKNAQLMNKKNMVGLELVFDDASDIALVEESRTDSAVLEALQPPPTLERLYIKGCRSITLSPHWMVWLTQLKSLTLTDCKCEHLPPLGELPQLESLKICSLDSVKRVANEFLGRENMYTSSSSVILFPKLKTFEIWEMSNWEDWEYETAGDITIMPCLSLLTIFFCPKLKQLPDQIFHASSRLRLELYDSPIVGRLFDGRVRGKNCPTVTGPLIFPRNLFFLSIFNFLV